MNKFFILIAGFCTKTEKVEFVILARWMAPQKMKRNLSVTSV